MIFYFDIIAVFDGGLCDSFAQALIEVVEFDSVW